MNFVNWTLYIIAIASAAGWLFFSTKARKSTEQKTRGLMTARVNICMGILLITIASIQIVLFESSTVRIIVGSLFLLLGFFNLFAGIRNHSVFSRM